MNGGAPLDRARPGQHDRRRRDAGRPCRRGAARPSRRDGHALRLDHDELFDVLSDHIDLLQGVFSGVLSGQDGRGRDPVQGRSSTMKPLVRVIVVAS